MRAESSLIDVGDDNCAFFKNTGHGGDQVVVDFQSGNTLSVKRPIEVVVLSADR